MEKTVQFSLEVHEGPYEKWPLASRLLVNGKETTTRISGFVIEGAYVCADGYLIITSWDCPYEEANNFTLLNSALEIVAEKSLGVMYDTYLLETHWLISDRAIRLHYYGDFFYTLSVEAPAWWQSPTPKLVLEQYKEFESDPQAMASLQAVRDAQKKTEDYLAARSSDFNV